MSVGNKDRVFSGVQPSGSLHIGNYLGAISNFVNFQDEYDSIFCIVDLHAITVWQDPNVLNNNIIDVAALYIASGIDPNKSTIFVQSHIPAHSELAWILNCISRIGWLNRMTQFKEKAGKNREKASAGLYVYPNLMASDILLYHANLVPVGDDQKQHLEITRDIAQKFNNDFKDFGGENFFPLPEPMILPVASRVMSLRDGLKKMSKSDSSEMTRIELLDNNDLIAKKISKAKTDPLPMPEQVSDLESRPEVSNLINIYSAFSKEEVVAVINKFEGKPLSEFKNELRDVVVNQIEPIREEFIKLKKENIYITDILDKGRIKAKEKSDPILNQIKSIVGLG
ncbi:MAG: tryptophan--tRNA ligase [Pseudomonadota bacterium]|nr:tryptophan--tRNA ligase [Pseudomonadota bacterium]MEC9382282.1 tryptophan--tRNA ligase [Pseudomonadota bacterium]MEC9459317.1 tryptophan--tRNA ligase [Pseudomonadota bacterium]